MSNGYEEATEIDKQIQEYWLQYRDGDIDGQRNILRYIRTIKTTLDLIEPSVIAKMEKMIQRGDS